MDLDNQGLSVHDNLAIRTNDLTALARSKEIFSEVFEEAKNYHRHQKS
ncbi:MAG: hypothetical protein K0S93_2326 [Nitrososphaeraceae archaeon]|jgi:hypothetical protein|nr:hypothetical protein [Nitrososphaeraceae archaeon]